jgi:hypothetical protein
VLQPSCDAHEIELVGIAMDAAAHGWHSLPRLPRPHPSQRRQEQLGTAIVVVSAIIASTLCELLTRFVATGAAAHVTATAVHGASVLAVICLSVILTSTSHTLCRAAQTTRPIPAEVLGALTGDRKMPKRNIECDDGSTFCVRCLLWRPAGRACHHCSVCQRCIVDFDHHCHILGRCIAGDGRVNGNLVSFRLLIVATAVGCLGTLLTVMVGIMQLIEADHMPAHEVDASLNASTATGPKTAVSTSRSARLAVILGALAIVLGLIILSCWLVGQLCQGAKQLTERSKEQEGAIEHRIFAGENGDGDGYDDDGT